MDVRTQHLKQTELVFSEERQNHVSTRSRRIDRDGDALIRITQQVTDQSCLASFDRLEMHGKVLPNDDNSGRRKVRSSVRRSP